MRGEKSWRGMGLLGGREAVGGRRAVDRQTDIQVIVSSQKLSTQTCTRGEAETRWLAGRQGGGSGW